ncbi:hypothetical protein N7539_005548 [Penicillium diatomitis]|uniref:Arylsulfotransferase n=1 Tax=Penicillium diatomitis TaxID=2819901 RepID=A0A9W9X8D4_9EURO|nr:uncharacterized protein N7539_005548 [Penicillium diatomitis]KAJ5485560.1 hypothetical protein N7539_005548 [Penicillium diatomitis]
MNAWERCGRILRATGAIVTAFLLVFFLRPQLQRFRFRSDLSWYDLGIYGFGPSRSYVSFEEQSLLVEITPRNAKCDPRYTLLAPRGDSVAHPGPMILDARGELVWMKSDSATTEDFRIQRYKGQDYLTYWEGGKVDGHGCGSWYMLDSAYTVQYIISPVGVMSGDLHEFQITANSTALFAIYDPIPADLTSVGGPQLGWVYDGVFQEVDIETGELIFEWRASQHFPPNASYQPLGDQGHERSSAFDFFHINSVDKDDQGRYLVSARHAHSVFYIDGVTGEVLWTLGGKNNDFEDLSNGAATGFSWQHDARWRGVNQITLFNNAANGDHREEKISHGALIELNLTNRSAELLQTYHHPQELAAVSQGNVQVLDSGNVFIGWGHSAAYTEFSPDGDVLCNVHYGASAYFQFGRIVSYRVTKGDWVGMPDTLPDVALAGDRAFVSWNGATEVRSWQIECWDGFSPLQNMTYLAVGQASREGFETEIALTANVTSYFRISALDANDNVLGTSATMMRATGAGRRILLHVNWSLVTFGIVTCLGLAVGLYFAIRRQVQHRGQSATQMYWAVAQEDQAGHTLDFIPQHRSVNEA